MSKKSRLIEPSHEQHGKRAQTLLNPASQQPDHIHWSLAGKLYSKNSFLLTCQIMGLLVNTLAADEKYPVLKRDNLTIAIQMQLSQKQKRFSEFFPAFMKSRLNFDHSEKKMTLRAFVFPKLWTLKT